MTHYSHTDILYATLHYTEFSSVKLGRTSGPDDFSFAMLDMTDSQFGDDCRSENITDDLLAYHTGADSSTGIYDAEFYSHTIHTTSLHDPIIEDTYSEIACPPQQDYSSRRISVTANKNYPCSRGVRARIVSVFDGSYDERNIPYDDEMEIDEDYYAAGAGSPIPYSAPEWIASCHSNGNIYSDVAPESNHAEGSSRGSSPSNYLLGRQTPVPVRAPNPVTMDPHDIPALSPDCASSPESLPIDTPAQSPISSYVAVGTYAKETSPSEVPDSFDVSNAIPVSVQPSYTILSNELIISSQGSDMGKICRRSSGGGFECSCSHRTGTVGDMTRHWQSKRHSNVAFECKACRKAYTRDDALKRHFRKSDECARKARKLV
ncbi:hypothetical protein AX15_006693 [Amanita polypyramis BW_CC]|nr:hypothetical protein AX15_006693 [Amanita polypyramis BW_CC]